MSAQQDSRELTPRELRHRGLVPDALSLVLVCLSAFTVGLLALLAAGCNDSKGPVGHRIPLGDQAPHHDLLTPEGVGVSYPIWLDAYPDHLAAALEEIRTVTPEADPRIPTTTRGLPRGSVVIVMDPGAFWTPNSPSQLAAGLWLAPGAPNTIVVAWRGTTSGPRLPALPHEARHLITQDRLGE